MIINIIFLWLQNIISKIVHQFNFILYMFQCKLLNIRNNIWVYVGTRLPYMASPQSFQKDSVLIACNKAI